MSDIDMSLGRRLALGFGAVLALLLLVLGMYLYGNQQQAEATSRLANRVMPRADAAGTLVTALLYQAAGTRAFVLSGDEKWLADYRSGVAHAADAISRLDTLPKTPEGSALFDQIVTLADRYSLQVDRAITLRRQGNVDEATLLLSQEMFVTRTELIEKADAFVRLQFRLKDEATADLERVQAESTRNSIVVALLAILLGAALAYRTARSVRIPVLALVGATDRIATGDYASAMDLAGAVSGTLVETRDEIRHLAGQFRLAARDLLVRERRLSAHANLSSVLASTIEASELTGGALRVLAEHVGAEAGVAYRYDSEARVLVKVGSHCLGETVPETVGLKDGIVGEAAASRRTALVRDIPSDLPFRVRLGVDDLPPRWVAAVPMLAQGDLVGAILLAGLRDLDKEALRFLESGTGQIAISLQNSLAHERIQAQNEELQGQNEEIRAQAEEIQAQGEEIQSQNEELQSQNEEILTQNDELQSQNEELVAQAQALAELGRVLSESEERFRTVFQQAAVGMARIGLDGRFLETNARLCTITGYSEAELSELTFQGITYPDDVEVDSSYLDQLRRGEIHSYWIEKRCLRKDGSVIHVDLTVGLVREHSGKPAYYIGIVEDVTDRKESETQQQWLLAELDAERGRLQAILNNAPQGIVFTDEQARILFSNHTADRLYARPIPYQQPFDSHGELRLCYPDGAVYDPRDLPLTRAALDGEISANVEMAIIWPDGQKRALLVNCAPLKDSRGRITGAVGVFLDVSEMKESERERERLLAEIQRRSAQQEEFIAIISHDLRSPITAIQGNAQLLPRYCERPEMVTKTADNIYTSARRMNRMIQDLVDSSKLEAGQLRMEKIPVDAASFVSDVKHRLSEAMDTARVRLETPPVAPTVLVDPDRLERVLTNLISNALKYSEGEVLVRAEDAGGKVRFSVIDHGPGISPSDLPRLFERYYRADSAKQSEGLGLGLYITRMLVEAHGGRVWVETEEGRGSTFVVELPAADLPVEGLMIEELETTGRPLQQSKLVADG